jgi:hypothetical protein
MVLLCIYQTTIVVKLILNVVDEELAGVASNLIFPPERSTS